MKLLNELSDISIQESIWQVIDTFCSDFKKQPTRWDMEINIQSELFHRLDQLMTLFGCNIIMDKHDSYQVGSVETEWSRVSCEPTIVLPNKDEIRPDIVIYDESDKSGKDKFLFIIEIKFNGLVNENDKNRITTLFREGLTKNACFLNFSWPKRPKPGNDKWKIKENGAIRLRNIYG